MKQIEQTQEILKVKADGIWGPISQEALNVEIRKTKKSNPIIAEIQKVLGVEKDGVWGLESQEAFNIVKDSVEGFSCKASSFADPADVRAFDRCKETAKTDLQCFAVGDNGIGEFGKITAQDKIPMIAVHKNDMLARWGSEHGAAHRPVTVTVNGVTFSATVEDRISAQGRIDLNPACAKIAGLQPPFVVPCIWRWSV